MNQELEKRINKMLAESMKKPIDYELFGLPRREEKDMPEIDINTKAKLLANIYDWQIDSRGENEQFWVRVVKAYEKALGNSK